MPALGTELHGLHKVVKLTFGWGAERVEPCPFTPSVAGSWVSPEAATAENCRPFLRVQDRRGGAVRECPRMFAVGRPWLIDISVAFEKTPIRSGNRFQIEELVSTGGVEPEGSPVAYSLIPMVNTRVGWVAAIGFACLAR